MRSSRQFNSAAADSITDAPAPHLTLAPTLPPDPRAPAPSAVRRSLTADLRAILEEATFGPERLLQCKGTARYGFGPREVSAAAVEVLVARGLLRVQDHSPAYLLLVVTELAHAVFGLATPRRRRRIAPRPTRRLKVTCQAQDEVLVPRIRVAGRWLELFGFRQGRPVEFQVEPGRIVISLADGAEP
ncbi:MAG TPA: SymE family type I addiction module toxin [Thermoanaerobaculia bacterium]|nr:SymE family type I addiction module toxin [Thermoanaerobaculia bacterium]